MADTLEIKSVRPKAYAVLRKADVQIAKSSASRIRGWKNWSRGTVIEERGWGTDNNIYVVSHYDAKDGRDKDVARAVAALRAAGWTVTDDGKIEALPVKS